MTDEQAHGLIGLGHKLVGSLPAQFLMLVVINLFFIGGLLWAIDRREDARERVLGEFVHSCLQSKP